MNLSLFSDHDLIGASDDSKIPTAMPSFDSQMSSNFAGPNAINAGYFAQSSISDFPKAEIAAKAGQEPGPNSMQKDVYYIWAKKWCGSGKTEDKGLVDYQYGFPAYDKTKSLLGFYCEVVSEGEQIVIIYVPISEYKQSSRMLPTVTETEVKSICDSLVVEMSGESASVHSLANHVGVSNLIEAASMYFWTKNMILADGSGDS